MTESYCGQIGFAMKYKNKGRGYFAPKRILPLWLSMGKSEGLVCIRLDQFSIWEDRWGEASLRIRLEAKEPLQEKLSRGSGLNDHGAHPTGNENHDPTEIRGACYAGKSF